MMTRVRRKRVKMLAIARISGKRERETISNTNIRTRIRQNGLEIDNALWFSPRLS